jgi:hypothetical protein
MRILIVDDHPIICEGLCKLLIEETDLMVCGVALIKSVHTRFPQIRILVFMGYNFFLFIFLGGHTYLYYVFYLITYFLNSGKKIFQDKDFSPPKVNRAFNNGNCF